MFEMNGEEPIRLASRTPKKFFNMNENPLTMNLNHTKAIEFMTKADGSLVSTFLHNGQLALKTKGSLNNEQTGLAWGFLTQKVNEGFLDELTSTTEGGKNGYTVNMELVSPHNRIVLPYQKTDLLVLNVIDNETGEVFYQDESPTWFIGRWVGGVQLEAIQMERFINSIPAMTDIEGFVIRYPDMLVKYKTDWYLTLHKTKDSVTIPRRLFECVIQEATDDLRSLFHNDQAILDKIKAMEDHVVPQYNEMANRIVSFVSGYKDLSRKDFAILGQEKLGFFFSLGMQLYLNEHNLSPRVPNFKDFAIKNYKLFGITDVQPEVTE